jgi:peptidoglycan/LPS O-acetylase OafA/YrhL
MVLVWHCFYSEVHPARHSALAAIAIPFSVFWSGVDLFFVLSGFLIGGILVDSREDRNYFSSFYVRRVCRLGPVYAMVLASYALASALVGMDGRFAWLLDRPMPALSYLTFSQNVFMGVRSSFGANWLAPTWSLAVEEQFYLLLPLLVRLLSPKALRRALAVAIVVAPALRFASNPVMAQVEMPMRSDSLLVGVAVALAVRDPRFLAILQGHRRAYGALFAVLLLGAGAMCLRASWFGVFAQTWLAALYSMLLLAPFARANAVSRVLRTGALAWFGKLSYSLYLTHLIVVGAMHALAYGREPRIDGLGSAALTAASLVASLALSYALFRTVETPAIAYGHRRAKLARNLATA